MKLIEDLGMFFPTATSKQKKRYGIYECPECGDHFRASTPGVKNGDAKHCPSCSTEKHGDSKSKLYRVYKGMLNRCHNPRVNRYERYGGRGIEVCEDWQQSYIAFRTWATAHGYHAGLSIDRRDNDGNYTPDNCRWTTRSVQATNTVLLPVNNTTGFRGVYRSGLRFRSIVMTGGNRINIGFFATALEAAIARDTYIDTHGLSNMKNLEET